jgi:hypothetical protein
VIITLPSKTQENTQSISITRTTTARRSILGVSKNSVVKELKTIGVSAANPTSRTKITLLVKADKVWRMLKFGSY